MLLEWDAVIWAQENLGAGDFYAPVHEAIYRAILAVHEEGSRADLVTVSDALAAKGQLDRVGGTTYLTTLQAAAPTAAGIAEYGRIVRDKARLRQGLVLAERCVTDLYGAGDAPADDLLRRMGEEWTALGQQGLGAHRWRRVDEAVKEAWADMETRAESREADTIPTGLHDLDYEIGGLQRKCLYVLAGRPRDGKALALDTLIPTPAGFKMMAQIHRGDTVYDADGQPCSVTFVSPVYRGHFCYRVTFDDGATVICDSEHLWQVTTRNQRKNGTPFRPKVMRTEELLGSLLRQDNRPGGQARNYAIKLAKPFAGMPSLLPIPPYTFGVWIGDGRSTDARVTTADPEIFDGVRSEGICVGPGRESNSGRALTYLMGGTGKGKPGSLHSKLRALGVLGDKHIPTAYLFASVEDRMALLQGLMDTDGTCSGAGIRRSPQCEFYTSDKRLAEQVLSLVCGLGIKAVLSVKKPPPKTAYRSSYRVTFTTTLPVFRLDRKRVRLPAVTVYNHDRRIAAIDAVPSEPVRCIAVDSPSRLYLCTDRFIPTHNTAMALNWLCHIGGLGLSAAMFSLEMSMTNLAGRVLASLGGVSSTGLRMARLDETDWQRAALAADSASKVRLWVDDTRKLDLSALIRRARIAVHSLEARVLAVDYLQLIHVPRAESVRLAVMETMHTLQALAGELDVPIIVVSQVGRTAEAREDKRPTLADLKESGAIEEDADVVLFIHHPRGNHGPGVKQIVVAKNRHGPTGRVIPVYWHPDWVKFSNASDKEVQADAH